MLARRSRNLARQPETLQAGMFPENTGSLSLHQSCGFREIGRRERIGKMNGTWRDTILLERRSTIVGVE